MQTTDPRLAGLRREDREMKTPTPPSWVVTVLLALVTGGLSSAVTYGATIARVGTIERDVAAAIVRLDRSDAARSETERTLAVVVTRLDAIAATQREQSADLRAVRESLDALRTRAR